MERQAKIQALHKKQTTNKAIIFSVSAIIIVALLVFGTYNTFFKKGLTVDDVNAQITQKTSTLYFPIEGVNEYIVDNSQTLFDKYIRLDPSYEYAKVDKNSIYIMRTDFRYVNHFGLHNFKNKKKATYKNRWLTDIYRAIF